MKNILYFIGAAIIIYIFLLNRDIAKVDKFCEEMKPGLDVNSVHVIANKYGVGFKNTRDTKSVESQSLGIKLEEQENTWFFVVPAPMTIGEHACGVYHNNKVILSAEIG